MPTKPKQSKTKLDLSNREIVVLAAYLSGAQYRYTDTEDIAVKADEIAPGRFSWRKYKDHINLDTVRKRLGTPPSPKGVDIRSARRRGVGWQLRRAASFAEANITKLTWVDLSKSRLSKDEEAWLGRERIRMTAEAAYRKFRAGKGKEVTPIEAERFFWVDDYVVGDARKAKLERASGRREISRN